MKKRITILVLLAMQMIYSQTKNKTADALFDKMYYIEAAKSYELSIKTMYTYDAAGNIKQFDLYSHDVTTSTDDLISTVVYTFDNKTAAISYGADAIGVGQPDLIAVNNILKAQITDVSDPANNQTIDFTYTYNSNNRPVTGTSTLTPGGSVKNISFYYQ